MYVWLYLVLLSACTIFSCCLWLSSTHLLQRVKEQVIHWKSMWWIQCTEEQHELETAWCWSRDSSPCVTNTCACGDRWVWSQQLSWQPQIQSASNRFEWQTVREEEGAIIPLSPPLSHTTNNKLIMFSPWLTVNPRSEIFNNRLLLFWPRLTFAGSQQQSPRLTQQR